MHGFGFRFLVVCTELNFIFQLKIKKTMLLLFLLGFVIKFFYGPLSHTTTDHNHAISLLGNAKPGHASQQLNQSAVLN